MKAREFGAEYLNTVDVPAYRGCGIGGLAPASTSTSTTVTIVTSDGKKVTIV